MSDFGIDYEKPLAEMSRDELMEVIRRLSIGNIERDKLWLMFEEMFDAYMAEKEAAFKRMRLQERGK